MDIWKKEYIQNQLYRLGEMVGDDPEDGEPTVESLMEEVQRLIEIIKE